MGTQKYNAARSVSRNSKVRDMKQQVGDGGQPMNRIRQRAVGLWMSGAAAALALGMTSAAAQAQTAVPVPMMSNSIGLAPGSGSTACTGDIPTFAVSPGPVHYGDGCVGNQATLSAPYSVSTDSLGNLYISDYNHFALRVLYNGGAALAAAIV